MASQKNLQEERTDYAMIWRDRKREPHVVMRIHFTNDQYREEREQLEKETDYELIRDVHPLTREKYRAIQSFMARPRETWDQNLEHLMRELDELNGDTK